MDKFTPQWQTPKTHQKLAPLSKLERQVESRAVGSARGHDSGNPSSPAIVRGLANTIASAGGNQYLYEMAKRGALAHIELPDPRYIAGPSTSAATAFASAGAGAGAAAGAASGGESSGGSAVSGADADGRQLRHETSNTINNIIAAKRADMNSSQSSMSFFSQES
ncbi:hypothetical protein BSLG_003906 [Batrachochytrium salamandrivorans]|nr:hypothetical protein BSLG_003906 [Batrachochytrium salamandrivorans]